MHASLAPRLLLPLLLPGLMLLASCGGEEDSPDTTNQEASSTSTGPVSTTFQRPAPPANNFSDRRPQRGADYNNMVARVQAAQDGWLTEVVAQAAEKALTEGIQAALAGDTSPLAKLVWKDFGTCDGLRPNLGEAIERAPYRLREATSERSQVSAQELGASVAEWVQPFAGTQAQRVLVHVTGVVAEPLEEFLPFTLEARIRIAGDAPTGHPEGSLQEESHWTMGWALGARGKRLGIRTLMVESFRSVLCTQRSFVDLTGELFPGELGLERGSLEYWKRVDRIAVANNVYLGMHGLGVGDLDGDGREDAYVAHQSGLPNQLWLGRSDGTFQEVGAERGVDFLDDSTGVLIVDLDGDGARELVMGMGPEVVVCWNGGGGMFRERTRLALPGTEQVYSISAADADGDGFLDLYATRYVAGGVIGGVPTPYHDANNGATNAFFVNGGDRTFRDGTEAAGLNQNNTRFSLMSLWEDLEGDGDLDLYVANDFGRNNLYRNDGKGVFVDVAAEQGAEDMAAGMGISVADVDLDGDLDVYVSNMFTAAGSRVTAQPEFLRELPLEERAAYHMHTRGNTLLLAQGRGRFRDATQETGVGPGGWAWGAMFTDFQNDGRPDIVVPNGFLTGREETDLESFFWRGVVALSPAAYPPTDAYRGAWVGISTMTQREGFSWNGPERNYAYLNLGPGQWVDVSAAAGFDFADDARVACVFDHDGDGQLDVLMRNRTAPSLRFLHGRGATGNWCSVQLEGAAPNTDGIGALVEVRSGEQRWLRRRYAGEGYLSCQSQRLHFGLGGTEAIDEIRVTWPNGEKEAFRQPPLNRRVVLRQGSGAVVALEPMPSGLSARRERRLPSEKRASVQRVPLLDTLPMSALSLPSFEGADEKLVPGQSTLVLLWGSFDEASEQTLRDLGAARDALEQAKVRLHPLTLDAVADLDAARALLKTMDLPFEGGRLDRRSRSIFEGLLVEVLGGFQDLPVPIGVLFDPRGHCCTLYVGGVDPAAVVRDAQTPLGGQRWPVGLTGGRWLDGGPSRSLGPFGGFLRGAGFADLANEIERVRQLRESRD